MDCVLVFRIGSLGDSIVATPALRRIRARFPHSRIVLLTNSPIDGGVRAAASHQVWAGSGLIDGWLRYPIGKLDLAELSRLRAEIAREQPHTAVYLMPRRSFAQRLRDWAFLRLTGVRRVIGLGLLSHPNDYPPLPGTDRHESEARRLLRSIGEGELPLGQADFAIGLTPTERAAAVQRIAAAGIAGRYLAISVGTKSPVNDWGQPHWRELIARLGARVPDFGLVAIGAASEQERCDELLRLWPGASANFCGRLEPRESAAVLEGASVYAGHDSGPMHLANSAGIPVVAVFSARELPGVWFPVGNEHNVFHNRPPCAQCRLDVCADKGAECIQSIEAAPVAARVLALLGVDGAGMAAGPAVATLRVVAPPPVAGPAASACGNDALHERPAASRPVPAPVRAAHRGFAADGLSRPAYAPATSARLDIPLPLPHLTRSRPDHG